MANTNRDRGAEIEFEFEIIITSRHTHTTAGIIRTVPVFGVIMVVVFLSLLLLLLLLLLEDKTVYCGKVPGKGQSLGLNQCSVQIKELCNCTVRMSKLLTLCSRFQVSEGERIPCR